MEGFRLAVPLRPRFRDTDAMGHLNNAVYGGNPDNVMTYAQIYVNSETAQDVYIASDSDDSIQILLNEEEVWINSIPRGNDAGCPTGLIPPNRDRLRDVTPAPFPLNAGENRLIVKTFEGGGDFNFEIRFENADAFTETWTWYQAGAEQWLEEVNYRRAGQEGGD